MQTVLIVIHLLIVLALVIVVLLQRSEGGGLGIGGGGGNMMAARASGNPLTRITGILAFIFFVTSLSLGILARYGEGPTGILDRIEQQTEGSGQGILDQLGGSAVPETEPTEDGQADVPAVPTDGGQSSDAPAGGAAGEAAPAGDAAQGGDATQDQPDAPAADDAQDAAPSGETAPQDAAPAEPAEPSVPTGQ